jgi:hypothetical protein
MWAGILAFLQAIPWLGRILERFVPSREEQRQRDIRLQKQREREAIDRWIDGDGPPPGAAA